jgi:SAM-dependent methyltransferase
MRDLCVQYGCGSSSAEGWLNFDSSPTLRFERLPVIGKLYTRNAQRFPELVRFGDIVKGLPVPAESCKAVYCSHVLEHLSREDVDIALRNTYRLLQPGGTFRLVLPDLEQLAQSYLASKDPLASSEFMESAGLGKASRPRGLRGVMVDLIGNSAHLWMWDERSLAHKLREHGFTDVRRAAFGDWADPVFAAVEDQSRFTGCLAMQCTKT